MKKKKDKRKACSQRKCSAEEHSKGKLVSKCGTILLVAASYQVFSLCMDPADRYLQEGRREGENWLVKASSHISSALTNPAAAQAPSINECHCVGGHVSSGGRGCGCTGCMGCQGGCQSCQGCMGRTYADEANDYNKQSESFLNAYRAGRWAEAETLIRQMLLFTKGPGNYTNLGLTLVYQGRYDEAEEALKKAKDLDGSWFSMPDYIKDAYNSLHSRKGNTLYNQGRYAEAENELKKALGFNSNDSSTYNTLGITLEKQKRRDEAIRAYEKALQIDPNNSMARGNLQNLKGLIMSNKANNLYDNKDYTGAEAAYREAIKLNPEDAHSHKWLVGALINQRRHADAEAAARQAVKLVPKNADAHNTLGVSLEKQDKFSEAEAAYREAIKLDPKNANFHQQLAKVLLFQGRHADAEAIARQAVKLAPPNISSYSNVLGVALDRQGKLSEAESAFRAAIKINPKNELPRNNLSDLLVDKGNGLYSQGKRSEAEAAFREAKTLNPASEGALKGLKLITSLAGLEFMVPANKPAGQQDKTQQGTITLVIKEDGRDVPVKFIIPHDPKSGPGQASAQLQSAAASGAQAKDEAKKAENDFHDPQGKLAEASHHAGDMFDRPGQQAKPLPDVELKGLPVQKERVIPEKLIKDEKFKNLSKTRADLIEKQQELENRLQEVRRKKENTTKPEEKGTLDVEEARIKQQQSPIAGQIRDKELEMGEMISRALLEWPKQEKGTDQNKQAAPQSSPENVQKKAAGGKVQ